MADIGGFLGGLTSDVGPVTDYVGLNGKIVQSLSGVSGLHATQLVFFFGIVLSIGYLRDILKGELSVKKLALFFLVSFVVFGDTLTTITILVFGWLVLGFLQKARSSVVIGAPTRAENREGRRFRGKDYKIRAHAIRAIRGIAGHSKGLAKGAAKMAVLNKNVRQNVDAVGGSVVEIAEELMQYETTEGSVGERNIAINRQIGDLADRVRRGISSLKSVSDINNYGRQYVKNFFQALAGRFDRIVRDDKYSWQAANRLCDDLGDLLHVLQDAVSRTKHAVNSTKRNDHTLNHEVDSRIRRLERQIEKTKNELSGMKSADSQVMGQIRQREKQLKTMENYLKVMQGTVRKYITYHKHAFRVLKQKAAALLSIEEDLHKQDIFMKQAKGRIAIASRAAEAANKRFNDSSRHIFRQSPERIAVNATKQATSIFDGLKAVNLHSFEFNRDHLVNFVERMNVLINGTYHLDVTMVYCERSFEQLMAALEQLEVITAQSSQSEKGKTQKELMTEYRNVAKLKKLVLPKKRQDQRDVRKFKETLAVIKRTQETASRLGKEFKAEAAWLEQVERKTIDALHRITNMIMQSKIKADKNFEASEQKFLAQMNDARRLEHRSAAEARKVAPGTGPNLQPAFV